MQPGLAALNACMSWAISRVSLEPKGTAPIRVLTPSSCCTPAPTLPVLTTISFVFRSFSQSSAPPGALVLTSRIVSSVNTGSS